MGFLLRESRRHGFSCLKKFVNPPGVPAAGLGVRWHLEPAGCGLPVQTGSCGVSLSAGSSSESGRGVKVDGELGELEGEEVVGEMPFFFFKDRHGRFLLPISLECQAGIKWEVGLLLPDRLSSQPYQAPGVAGCCLSWRGSPPWSLLQELAGSSIFFEGRCKKPQRHHALAEAMQVTLAWQIHPLSLYQGWCKKLRYLDMCVSRAEVSQLLEQYLVHRRHSKNIH